MRKSPFPWVSSPGGSGSGSDLPFARKHSSSPSMAFPRRPTRSLALFTYILAAVCIYVIFFRPQVPVLEPEEYGERIADDGQDISDSHGSSSSSRSSQSNAGASASTAVTAELLRQSVTTSGADSDMEKPYGPAYHGHSTPADVNRVTNATLGFQKVLVLHLPSRSDKRDALALASALTGFGPVEYVEGVRGDTVPDKALPPGGAGVRKTGGNGYVGSWRGHMNAIRKIVEENLESALILEDDVDWDVRLKPQLELIAEGSRSLLTSPDLEATRFSTPMAKAPFTSPYGPGWDLMWLGHCGEVFPEQLQELSKLLPPKDANTNSPTSRENHAGGAGRPRLAEALTQHAIYPIMDDPTVPPAANTTGLVDFAAHPPHTRWVHVSGAPICTFAYALSQQGARKVLLSLGVEDWHEPFDNAIAGMCRKAVGEWPEMIDEEEDEGNEDGARRRKKKTKAEIQDRSLDMRCLSVTPPVFFHHKAKGSVEADSDIRQVDADDKLGGGTVRDKGWTENIVWSARLNLRNMVLGRKIESQF